MISSACAGMNRYLNEHPGEWAGYLCPVFSPLLCAARYLKTYRLIQGPFAFLSPCILKKGEFITENQEELVRYNITIEGLNNWLNHSGIDIQQYDPHPLETDHNGKGLTLAAFGGIGKVLAALVPDINCQVEQGTGNAAARLVKNREFGETQGRAVFFEPYACIGGCANGPGLGKYRGPVDPDFCKSGETADLENIFSLFSHYDDTLRLKDFCRPISPPQI
jgi:iron only hydrogenase large subunit-like protein